MSIYHWHALPASLFDSCQLTSRFPLKLPEASDRSGLCCLNGLRSATRASLGGVSRPSLQINISQVRPTSRSQSDRQLPWSPLGNGVCVRAITQHIKSLVNLALRVAQPHYGGLWVDLFFCLDAERGRYAMKLVGFMLGPEHEENLKTLAKELNWSRSRVIRELLAHVRVRSQPSIEVTSGAELCVGQ
jgi:hypothetical protein